ncbi:hypothetical protein SCP_0606820 [Sparassis crispa]|uniref:DUF6589 domain-containing protein n=1 Tax=Sparassis crispa TaxID=139825 RepID=A0A401GR54_9APHY|nr:hypothetical protein SCP_0606820 [Sparassis crispa]GBE84702.1 hypothetical protein SCP_0606820 [Sparassis crispa]
MTFPIGKTWVAPKLNDSSTQVCQAAKSTALPNQKANQSKKNNTKHTTEPFTGDRTLAQSIMFMHDTLLSQKVARAVAEGDIGRVYEGIKMMLFSFAGSSHLKYVSYLLETICDLELESSEAAKDVFLKNWLVNPSGKAQKYQEGDFTQERYNRELETFVDRKDTQWNADYICKVISPNVHHFMKMKNTYGDGVGLAKHRGEHREPHSKSEVRTLLETYRSEELHRFRSGHSYDSTADTTVDTFGEGVEQLYNGKLQKWITDSTSTRATRSNSQAEELSTMDDADGIDDPYDYDNDDEEDHKQPTYTSGNMVLVDGELQVKLEDISVQSAASYMDEDVDEEVNYAEDSEDTHSDTELGEM